MAHKSFPGNLVQPCIKSASSFNNAYPVSLLLCCWQCFLCDKVCAVVAWGKIAGKSKIKLLPWLSGL